MRGAVISCLNSQTSVYWCRKVTKKFFGTVAVGGICCYSENCEETQLLGLEALCPTMVIGRLAYPVDNEAVETLKGIYRDDGYRL